MKMAFKLKSRDLCPSSFMQNVLLLLFIVTFFINSSAEIYIHSCNNNTYANGSELKRELNTVLHNLVQQTLSSGGFITSVSGQSPNKIYGLLQCRGDLTQRKCYNCSEKAKASILRDCLNAVGGRGWFNGCFLRYEKYNFTEVVDDVYFVTYNKTKTADPRGFDMAIGNLSKNLLQDTFSSPKRYAVHSTVDSWTNDKMQGLAQCWMDISNNDCQECLSKATRQYIEFTNGTQVRGACLGGICFVRYEMYDFSNDTPSPSLPPGKSLKGVSIIFGSVGGFLMTFLVGLFTTRKKFKSAVFGNPVLPSDLRKGNEYIDRDLGIIQDHRLLFNIETLKAATRNFHDDSELGKGGFGTVYKGTLPDGREIAVKKLSLKFTQGKNEFLNEVKLTTKIQHRHLVNLLGCCVEGSERMLVYEYLPNRSLEKILFDSELSKQIDWQKRFAIIIGIARGLLYLHEDSQPRIIHRDIKTSNILLDGKMNPKIADFGLARLFPEDETHVNTQVVGTFGYMAPEYAMQGQLSVKADVYGFGVVLLEIVCGRKNTDFNFSTEFQSLLELIWTSYSEENIVEIMDRTIVESCSKDEALRCIHVGLLCTQADASLRPSISSVNSMLLNSSITKLPDPTMPAFVKVTHNKLLSPMEGSTINNASITNLGGR